MDLNHRPLGYEPNELPDCSTPQPYSSKCVNDAGEPNRRALAHQREIEWVENCIADIRDDAIVVKLGGRAQFLPFWI
jgi:hypothetical protein